MPHTHRLGSFAVKAQLAFALGLISSAVFENITIVRKLRNDFAHSHAHLDFKSKGIEQRLRAFIGPASPPQPEDEQFIDLPEMKAKSKDFRTEVAPS